MLQHNHILHKRYAKALLALAQENNILERSYADMQLVHGAFAGNKELAAVLKSPVTRLSKKSRIISKLFENRIHPLILKYIQIIMRKQRGFMLEGIASVYQEVYKQHLGIARVEVITAVPMDDTLRRQAMDAATRLTDHEIEFDEKVNPAIMGGFIIRIGEKQYNASVYDRLVKLKKHLNL